MQLIYKDPKKKGLQKLEIALMVILLPLGLYWGAQTYQTWQNFEKAEALYQEAALLGHGGNSPEAVKKLEEAVTLYPEFYAAWEELAVSYHMMKDYEKAINAYERGVAALPENGNLRRELATSYHYGGYHDKELEAAQIATALPNSDPLFTSKILSRAEREASGEIETGHAADFEAASEEMKNRGTSDGHNHSVETHSPDDGHDHSGHDH
jgi:tetratricopeptide (TPR) repeat protein